MNGKDIAEREPDRNGLKTNDCRVRVDPSSRFPIEVVITKASNGFIIRVGCRTFVGKDWEEVSKGLEMYWERPEKAEQLYLKKY